MHETYEAHGIRFCYPRTWDVSESQEDNELTVSVHSPETSYWSVVIMLDRPDPAQVVESAVKVFRKEYDEIDVYLVEAGERDAVARDLEFVCYELLNSAFLRSFQTDGFTVLVLYQGNDRELEETKQTLEAISNSLQCEQETDSPLW